MKLLTRIRRKEPLTREDQYILLSMIPLYFMAVGLVLQPVDEIFAGIIRIFEEPDFLITDYFVIGGFGAAFFNAGIITLISIAIVYILGKDVSGHTITSVCLMFGFSLFGKNLLNIWLILFGVFLYSKYHKESISRYIYIGYYGTSLSPIITEVMQIEPPPTPARFILCALVGISIGFVLPPLATHVHNAH